MSKANKSGGETNGPLNFLSSIRLTVGILLSLAATSIIGTLIPQNADPEAYREAFGDSLFRFFLALNLFDMYHSWWFQFLVLLLAANIIVCSINRLSAIWKIVFTRHPTYRADRFRSIKEPETFTDSRAIETLDALKTLYRSAISKQFGRIVTEEKTDGFIVFAEKWRWSRLGVYVVHTSVIVLLAGALIGSFFGFEGYVNIPEGESAQTVQLRNTGREVPLPFEIRCDDFDVSFYTTGEPKEYRSSLTLIENGKEVLSRDIIVNNPLRYKGINIFQSSYGKPMPEKVNTQKLTQSPGESVELSFTSKATGMSYHHTAKIGEPVEIPEGLGKFVITEFNPSAQFMGQNIGEAYVGILTPTGNAPVEVTLPVRFPNFDKMRRGDVVISIEQPEAPEAKSSETQKYYTGLQITKDPGVWVVYTGFMLMILGCFITFFMSHQQIYVEVTQKEKTRRVMVAGIADKNKIAMRQTVKKVAMSLKGL
jgi:cytochrome c biogenesis protein